MKINWKVRFKNPVFWFNLAASIFLPMLACLGFNWEDMTSWQAAKRVLTGRPEPRNRGVGSGICMEPVK